MGSQTRITISKLSFALHSSGTKTTTDSVTYTGACNQFLINLTGKEYPRIWRGRKAKVCICIEGDQWVRTGW